jgi:DnaJ-class molecular chaperone
MAPLPLAEIRALAGILDELDYYQVLEVGPEAPSSSIRKAYHRASRRYHPDANRDLDPSVREGVVLIAKRVTEAYSVLRDPRRRQVYDRQLSESRSQVRMHLVQAEVQADRQRREEREGRTANGRRYFALAESDLSRGDRAAAERNLRTALAFEPDNTFFRSRLDQIRKG